jgi:4-hydroxy-tetrahydrodipicolinate synthase
MPEIRGVVVPLVTPFNQDESVDEGALRVIVDYLIEAGVHGLFPSGSQGELYALTTDEKKRLMEVVVDQAAGRAFVMPSTGAVTTRESIDLTRHAEACGSDAVSVITPYFIQPSAEEQVEHFTRIADSVSIPVLAYNNPARTSVVFTPAMAAAVAAKAANFVGIKDSSGDLTNTLDYQQRCPPGFRVFVGRDTLIYAALCCGCTGAVAATANVAPELVVGIYNAYHAGDAKLAQELQHRLDPLRHAFSLGSFPVVFKDAMELLGLPAGRCRAPIRSLEGAPRQRLIDILKGMGKLA